MKKIEERTKPTSASYTARLTLGQYQHEEISVTLEPLPGEVVNPVELIEAARRAVLSQTTAAKKRTKGDT